MGAVRGDPVIVPEQEALVPVVERRHQTGDFRSHAEIIASYGFDDRCGRLVPLRPAI